MHDVKFQTYEICVEEHLNPDWTVWFEGLTIQTGLTSKGMPFTILSGSRIDQSALHGLLAKVRDLGLTILFVRRKDKSFCQLCCK